MQLTHSLIAGVTLVTLGLVPVAVHAQETGGVAIDASGSNEVYQSDAGASGERVAINRNPGVTAANAAEGTGNREERQASRRDERQAARAANAGGEAPAAEPAAFAPADTAAAPVEAAAPGPDSGTPLITALPDTGVGVTPAAPLAAVLSALGLAAAGAAVATRRGMAR